METDFSGVYLSGIERRNMKKFIITVDTEGDNLWRWNHGEQITTENTRFIPRFQECCEKYGFRPVYLTNYEMAMDDRWVKYATVKACAGKCEIGMHLHAWNTPPEHELVNNFGGNPYITEYPEEIIDAKVSTMMELLQDKFQCPIVSHRSGRWALNEAYLKSLSRHGIRIDCSVTPEADLSRIAGYEKMCGNDYRKAPRGIYHIQPNLLEVPMTTRNLRHACQGSLKHRVKTLLCGEPVWLRPLQMSVNPLKELTDRVMKEKDCDHLEFMIHSSELMPGGSPYFKTNEDVERLFATMDEYFNYLSQLDVCGTTLQEFADSAGSKPLKF